MLIPNQKIELQIKNKYALNYYQKFYPNIKMSDKIIVPAEQLQENSSKKVKIQCDICEKVFERSYGNYIHNNHSGKLDGIRDTCVACGHRVAGDTYKRKTGYNCPAANPNIQLKAQQDYFNKTGYLSPNQNPEVKNKKAENYFNKTGYINPSQNPEVQRKKNETYFQNTGYSHWGTSPEDRQKAQNTYYQKTGYYNPMQNPKNASRKSSLVCDKMVEIIKNNFQNVETEIPFKRYSLDCVVNINDCKIDIEYDGWFFHKGKEDSDNKRNDILIKNGYKVIRIKSGSLIPNEKDLIDIILEMSKDKTLVYKEMVLPDWEYRETNETKHI